MNGLPAGTRIGVYEIQSPLGAGGMGEVYRARDTKLGREVAIKILPAAFTSDPERLVRFEREARMLASLNHPHIGAIYGFEDSSGQPALVREDRAEHGADAHQRGDAETDALDEAAQRPRLRRIVFGFEADLDVDLRIGGEPVAEGVEAAANSPELPTPVKTLDRLCR